MAGGDRRAKGTRETTGIRRAWAAGVLAVCMVLVAGCSGGGGGVADPPGSSATAPGSSTSKAAQTPTPKPAPTPAAVYKPATADGPAKNVPVPVLPAAAKEFSKKGLEEFARYWYSTLGYAFETGDAGPMMAVSDSACRPCTHIRDALAKTHAEGKWVVGGQMIVQYVSGNIKPATDGTYQTITTVRQQRVQYYKPDKSLSTDSGITKAIDDIVVTNYVNGQWIAQTVEHLRGSKGD